MATVEPGRQLSQYRLLEKIGEGGMGEVYRALDTRLDREVAVKVLPAAVAGDPGRLARFEREAKAVASLSHPNILEIHDFGREGKVTFAVTELLEGETLRDRLGASALPWRRAAEVAAAIADGLAAAHARGVVHRDLKPENVFLTTDGRVKILDFGLARVETELRADMETRTSGGTSPGTVLGTVGYMSPEQVRGAQADARSDIFSLGCILYEMVSGGRPFARGSTAETMAAILKEEPSPPSSSEAGFAPELDRIVAHCLEKVPDQRFQSASDLAFDLRSLAAGSGEPATTGGAGARSWWGWLVGAAVLLAVLVMMGRWWLGQGDGRGAIVEGLDADRVAVAVFENRTGDPAHDSLGKMAADWVTQGLIRVDEVDVVPSTGALFSEQAGDDPIRSLALQTGAGVVVSGAYYLQGETLQFHAAVTDVAAGKLLNSLEPVESPVSEPMAGIEELSQRIMGLMAGRENLDQISHPPRFEAYQEYLAGIDVFGRDNARAIVHFERAAAADPEFPAPLLFAVYIYAEAGLHARADTILAGLQERRHKLSLYEQLWLDVHLARRERNYTEVLRLVRKAEERAPRDIMIQNWVGVCALNLNRPRLADAAFSGLEPERLKKHVSSVFVPQVHASALHMLGEHERELEVSRLGISWYPDDLGNRVEEVSALAALGRTEEVDRVVQSCLEMVSVGEYDVVDVMLSAARELRAHGYREDSLRMAGLAGEWLQGRSQAEGSPPALREDLGEALYRAERWDEAREIFRELSTGEAGGVDHLGRLGTLAARAGEGQTARRISEELAALSRPYLWGSNTIWRARIAALLGEREEAMSLLRDAFAQGYTGYFYLHCDMDLESLREYPPYRELSRPRE